MLEARRWKRHPIEHDWLDGVPAEQRLSSRAAIVLLFLELLRDTHRTSPEGVDLQNVPTLLVDDTLGRYAAIGARLDRLYRVLFGTTYARDRRGRRLWRHRQVHRDSCRRVEARSLTGSREA